MEPEVHVDRCVLRIRRANGWSWGPDPDALIRAATSALPALLARHVVRATSGTDDTRIAGDTVIESLRLTIPVTLDELALLHAGGDGTIGANAMRQDLDRRMSIALAAALDGTTVEIEEPQPEAASPAPEVSSNAPPSDPGALSFAIARSLAAWASAGQHVAAIGRLSAELVRHWRAVLDEDAGAAGETAAVSDAEDVQRSELLAAESALPSEAHMWLAAVASSLPSQLGREAVARAVRLANAVVGRNGAADPELHVGGMHQQASIDRAPVQHGDPGREPDDLHAEVRSTPHVSARATEDVEIDCALPFLALVPLSRSGWLATLDATARALEITDLLPAIASALAYKLLAPALRGWHRSAATQTAAAAFAGQTHYTGASLVARARLLDQHVAEPLAATITSALVAGHTRGVPVIVHADGRNGYHLLERDGLFALEWSQSPRRLATAIDELVLVPAESATPELLDALDLANRRFVTDAPPSRSEAWRELPGGLRTNETSMPAGKLVAMARRLDEVAEHARALDDEITRRPGLPLATSSAFERALAQAAVIGLADLSWTLFRDRELATPALALHRFGDLSARVTFGADVVRVRIPLGRRHADLFAHRYTGEVHGVPWLDGRVVEICGG